MARLTQADLNEIAKPLEGRTPGEILHWAREVFGERLAALSAMQMAGSVMCHLLHANKINIPILFVDTGVSFQETLETRDRIGREYGLRMITLYPQQTMEEQTQQLGVLYLTPDGQKQCCSLRKIEPLRALRGQYDGLVGSLRRAEGGKRGQVPIVAIDGEMNAVRINPLANLSDDDMDAYLKTHQVIVNPLHSQGFTTIGCNRCTTPVLANEPPRAGRWRHLGPWSAYCHINPTDRDDAGHAFVELPQETADRLLGRLTDFTI